MRAGGTAEPTGVDLELHCKTLYQRAPKRPKRSFDPENLLPESQIFLLAASFISSLGLEQELTWVGGLGRLGGWHKPVNL